MHPRRGTSGACRSTIQWCAGRLPTYGVVVSIPFPELRALLDDQVLSAQTILGRDLIGSYIVLPASFGRQWGLLGGRRLDRRGVADFVVLQQLVRRSG